MKIILFLTMAGLTVGSVLSKEKKNLGEWTSVGGKKLEAKGISWNENGVNVMKPNAKKETNLPFKLLTTDDVKKALDRLPFHVNDEARLAAKTVRTTTQRKERKTGDYFVQAKLYSYDGYSFRGEATVTAITEKYKLSGRTVEVEISSPYGDGVAGVEFFAIRGKGNNRKVYSAQTGVFTYRKLGSIKLFSAQAVEDFQGWVVVVRSPNTGEITAITSSMRHLEGDVIPNLPKIAKFKTNTQPIKNKVLKSLKD